MTSTLETVSSWLSYIRPSRGRLPFLEALDYFHIDADYSGFTAAPTTDLHYLNDLYARILHRGVGTLPSLAIERLISQIYGAPLRVEPTKPFGTGTIEWEFSNDILAKASQFSELLTSWRGDPALIPLDPAHPENERRLLRQLLDHYGPRLAACLYTQVHIVDLLPPDCGHEFGQQRVDFLIALPNGRCIILEPGDHEEGPTPLAQIALDQERDRTFLNYGVPTLRFANVRIGSKEIIDELDVLIAQFDGHRFFAETQAEPNIESRALSHLLLLPTLLARIEHVLAEVMLHRGLISQRSLSLCIVEHDLSCAELAVFGFLERLQRIATLTRIDIRLPDIDLVVVREFGEGRDELAGVRGLLTELGCQVSVVSSVTRTTFDLSLDVAIKSNNVTPPVVVPSLVRATIRNAFPHAHKYRFAYTCLPREVFLEAEEQPLIESFLADFFRKEKLRPGQFPIIRNVMAQKPTIGLLPTSAGKSICFQLASLLTPGITLVVDPIVFLMKDQVLGLCETHGITAVASWHAEAGLYRDEQVGELMATNLMIFLSPERFLRPSFRTAMKNLVAGDLFLNYAVIDEAHCVSMWGHDFRPPYLMLERCFREFCTLRGRQPVVVALTGTASQLVLIDLRRQLGVEDLDSIIRPNSFDRPELTYNVVTAKSTGKKQMLSTVFHAIERRLGIQDIKREACGVLFANKPSEVWELYGEQAGDADSHVIQIGSGPFPTEDMTCAMACGAKPNNSPVSLDQWKEYKNKALIHFKRGRVKLLIGNAAIGVGIDNEYVNYVVVYCLPSSLESLGQQWGRAGRRGQASQCYLIYADDQQALSDRWLNGELSQMPHRRDDMGTISWFHSTAFPGEQEDATGTISLLGQLFRQQKDTDGRRNIRENDGERTQRYLSFLNMLGLVNDYEVTGIGGQTRYRVALSQEVEDGVQRNDEELLHKHLIQSLQSYLSRYKPTTVTEIFESLNDRPEQKLSGKAVGYLIHFIYTGIAYQRKESIRTIVGFCREKDQSSEAIHRRMKAFFDRNPKFSDRLDDMALQEAEITRVMEIITLIEGYDDAEQLFWETRRLLDERFRADWATVNLYSVIYREKSVSRNAKVTFVQILNELEQGMGEAQMNRFLIGFFNGIGTFDRTLREDISQDLLPQLFQLLFEQQRLDCLPILDELSCHPDTKAHVQAIISAQQMKGLLNVVKYKHGLG